MSRWLLIALGWALPALAALAQPAEVFFGEPTLREHALSPDGQRVAVVAATGKERTSLTVFQLGAQLSGKRIARLEDADIASVRWVDSERLVFKSGQRGLFAIDADGSQLRVLIAPSQSTQAVRAKSLRGLGHEYTLLSVPEMQPTPGGAEVIVAQMLENKHGQFGEGASPLVPHWLDVRTGTLRDMALQAPPEVRQWWFDRKGQARLARAVDGLRETLHWRETDTATWKPIVEQERASPTLTPVAVDDTGKLWVRHGTGAQGHNVLARFDFEKKAPDVKPFVAVPGFDFRGEIVRHGLGVRVHADAETTVWFDDAMRRLQALADERWPGSVNQVSCVRCGQPDMVATVFTYADRDPGQLWVFRQATASWLSLGKVRPQVDPSKMASVDFQRVRSRDGLPVPVWITSPAGAPAGRALPTVVLVNDNHQQRGGFWRWQGMEQFLASRGYLVLRPEFRGLDGYGAAHANAGRREWGRAINDDIADVLRWAQSKGLASPQACIAGRKFGGYTALMSLARDPKLYRCGIVWSAWADLELFLQGSNWVDDMISDEWRAQWAPLVAVDPKDRTEVRARSPLRQAAQITAPLLLAWGEKDNVAPIAHGQRLREALRENGNEALWVSYADEGHGWELPETKIDFARRVEQFLARHLGPEAAAAPR